MIKIGEGKTASVYSDEKHAYKVYHPGYNIENIHYEIKVQNEIADNTNLKVCHYENVNNTIKMDLLQGATLAHKILVDHIDNWLDDFTNIQRDTYQYTNLELVDAYKTFEYQVRHSKLPENLKANALKSLYKIKKVYTLCHLDFHPENIICDKDTYYTIDWTNAKLANPSMDIASTYIILRQYAGIFAKPYLDMMIKKTGITVSEIDDAIPLMAFIKLMENSEEDQRELLTYFVNKTFGV